MHTHMLRSYAQTSSFYSILFFRILSCLKVDFIVPVLVICDARVQTTHLKDFFPLMCRKKIKKKRKTKIYSSATGFIDLLSNVFVHCHLSHTQIETLSTSHRTQIDDRFNSRCFSIVKSCFCYITCCHTFC